MVNHYSFFFRMWTITSAKFEIENIQVTDLLTYSIFLHLKYIIDKY